MIKRCHTETEHQSPRFFEPLPGGQVRCLVCPHHCVIESGDAGVCQARVNRGGILELDVAGVVGHADPIEKKPFYHYMPGSLSYSVGVPGCNLDCPYCINWELSQPHADGNTSDPLPYIPPKTVLAQAEARKCGSIAYTYTEPAIFLEYVLETAQLARTAGLKNLMKTNGFATLAALECANPLMDAVNVDLKSFREQGYRILGGELAPVLEALRAFKAAGLWIEVTSLIVPGFNDGEDELRAMARFIVNDLGESTPWHLHRFFPNYKMAGKIPTSISTLERGIEIAADEGLSFVYLSNLSIQGRNDTVCPHCGMRVIGRPSARAACVQSDLNMRRCGHCGWEIAGIWTS